MKNNKLYIFIFLTGIFISNFLFAQSNTNENFDSEKIRGVSHYIYPSYSGNPFLNTKWLRGNVIFNSGEKSESIMLRYSSYKDEVVYYNDNNNRQIVIDKASITGFSFESEYGKTQVFRKQFYDNYPSEFRFFEVLSEGVVDLLAYRNVSLINTSAYKDQSGILKNMIYINDYQFYLWHPEKGYSLVKLNSSSLISKFGKTEQKQIKKLIRKNRLDLNSEADFIHALKLTEAEGYILNF